MKFIFEIKLKPGFTANDYRAAWEKGSAIIQKELGAQGTKLHQKMDDPNTLLAIASWESKELRDQAMERLEQMPEETREVLKAHEAIADFNWLGHFEQIAEVTPQ